MEATFYGVLGVPSGADDQTIVHAFRERAKTRHPDVNDSPDATEQFKRLQTAKRVLTDPEERDRYDRLGHVMYLHRTDDCTGWEPPDSGAASRDYGQHRDSPSRHFDPESARSGPETGRSAGGAASTASPDSATASRASTRTTRGRQRSRDQSVSPRQQSRQGASAGVDGTATAYYQPGQRMNPVSGGHVEMLLETGRSVGIWAVIHLVLVLSAVTTAWLILTWGGLSPVSLVLATVVLAAMLSVSVLHLSVRVYS